MNIRPDDSQPQAEVEPSLPELLSRFCEEADSYNGVTGPTARALLAAMEETPRLIEAANRLMAEIFDDGITQESLTFAREALAIPRQNYD